MKIVNKYIGLIMMGATLVTMPSCTDSWNDHFASGDDETATENLWELIESREDLSRLRSVLETAQFYRDETHPAVSNDGVKYTYKDVLSGNNTMTLWAPTNDALSEAEWQEWERMAREEGYNFNQQCIGNHLSLFRKINPAVGADEEKVRLVNNKIAYLSTDADSCRFAGIGIKENVKATNGLLNILNGRHEFTYNIYEYIKYDKNAPTLFSDYVVSRDTTMFDKSGSIEGQPDANGNPTYVDSSYVKSNMNFLSFSQSFNQTGNDDVDAWESNQKSFYANINTEDSLYILLVPSDIAWKAAYNKMLPYYKYGEKYGRMDKTIQDMTKKMDISTNARPYFPISKLTYYTPDQSKLHYKTVDSLQYINICMDIAKPLAFNLHKQPQVGGKQWTMEDFITKKGYKKCKYLLNTIGDTIRDLSIFDNVKVEKKSNGYVLVTDNWNIPTDVWLRSVDVEANSVVYNKPQATTSFRTFEINNNTAKDWIDEFGKINKQNYLRVYASTGGTTLPSLVFKLLGSQWGEAYPMSGEAEVQVVLVPDWYRNSGETPGIAKKFIYDPNMNAKAPNWFKNYTQSLRDEIIKYELKDYYAYLDSALVIDTANVLKNRLKCTLYFAEGKTAASYKYSSQGDPYVSEVFDYDGLKVDTVTVKFKLKQDKSYGNPQLPCSYKNLNNAYPVLKIENMKPDKGTENSYSYSFSVDRIVFKNKSDE